MKKNISLFLVIMLLATALVGCGGTSYEDGQYTGQGTGMEPMTVDVTVEDGEITDIQIVEHNESEGYYEEAFEEIPKMIIEKNSTDVDAVAGATMSSNGIINAVNDALEIE